MPGVERVVPILKPFKLASREFKAEDTVFPLGEHRIGGGEVVVMAGPCSVESRNQIIETAIACKEAGAHVLRGGAFKPRTSPYAFQGMGEEGLKYLAEAREITGMPILAARGG
jgi:3-deoxy-7-phosphoheptulonate synthase